MGVDCRGLAETGIGRRQPVSRSSEGAFSTARSFRFKKQYRAEGNRDRSRGPTEDCGAGSLSPKGEKLLMRVQRPAFAPWRDCKTDLCVPVLPESGGLPGNHKIPS